jgi:hypothetical protein
MKDFWKVLKSIVSGMACGFVIGLLGGMLLGIVVWPLSNLAPTAGFIYGIPVGTGLGGVYGLVVGIIKSRGGNQDD